MTQSTRAESILLIRCAGGSRSTVAMGFHTFIRPCSYGAIDTGLSRPRRSPKTGHPC
jgi:hypothetical protein